MRTHEASLARTAPEGEGREPAATPDAAPSKQRRGFAVMDPEKRKLIASLGGKACHQKGTGHEWDPEKAREAGRKGGLAAREARRRLRSAAREKSEAPEVH